MTVSISDLRTPIGGFFESHRLDLRGSGPGVLDAWTGGRPHAAFASARGAFAGLAALYPAAAIWLPAFMCADLVTPGISDRIRFYPVREGFAPDLTRLEDARPGDIAVLVAHFGLPVDAAGRDLARRRGDLILVEDRAQALGPGLEGSGGYELYSPRKLLGIADGGVLIAPGDGRPLPRPGAAADEAALWHPADLRAVDVEGRDNLHWHAANQAKEAAMPAAGEAITRRSLDILQRAALSDLAEKRFANWRRLDARLADWSALPPDPPSPPLGYVLRLEPKVRDRLRERLQADRIFAAIHWPRLAAPAVDFPRETAWTRELLTLPCDHRYGAGEMDRVADCVERALR